MALIAQFLRWRSVSVFVPILAVPVTRCRPSTVTVCVEASAHVEPERGGAVCGHPESPQRGGGGAGDGDAEAGGGAAPRLKHTAHWSR